MQLAFTWDFFTVVLRGTWHASKGNGKSSVPQPPVVRLSKDERVAEARARVRLEAALQVLGEESPEAQPIKESLLKAREQSRVQPVGERSDSTLKLGSCPHLAKTAFGQNLCFKVFWPILLLLLKNCTLEREGTPRMGEDEDPS